MGAIEILAGVFAIATILKLAAFFWKPDLMKSSFNWWIKRTTLMWVIMLVCIGVVGYYVLTSLSVLQVLAVFFLTHFMLGLFFLSYPKAMEKLYKEIMKVGLKKAWLPMVLYLVLSVWALYVLFA